MSALILYLNELSLSNEQAMAVDKSLWREAFWNLASAIDDAFSVRIDCKLAFPPNSWNAECGESTVAECFRLALSKERYLRVLKRTTHLSFEEIDLAREVHFGGVPAVGMVLADIAASEFGGGWVVSLSRTGSPWHALALNATRTVLDESGNAVGPDPCEIANIASAEHVNHWRVSLTDWGHTVSASAHLADVAGHPVVMYSAPLEHGPPHVHLLESRSSPRTLAKFRIDVFERPKGPPHWDAEMAAWVELHKEQLLRSWKRCQAGGHPYKLTP